MSRRIVMAGPALTVQGGMTSVERVILDHPPDGWRIDHVPTFVDGAVGARATVFGRGLRTVMSRLPGASGLHVHMSQRADVIRAIALMKLATHKIVPTLLHAHASEFHAWFDGLPPPVRRVIAGNLRSASMLAVLSESWKRYYCEALRLPEGRVVVLPNPVTIPARPAPGSRDDVVRAVFLGRIGVRKGAFDLVRAVGMLTPEVRGRLRLVMAGDGALEDLATEIRTAGAEDVIELKTWLSPDERDALLQRSDVFVLPSRNEGLPMALLEAMAHGLAPVVSPVGGIPDVVRDGEHALLVPPNDPAALARALDGLVRNETDRRGLGHRARERVLPFASDRYVRRLADIYARLESSDSHA